MFTYHTYTEGQFHFGFILFLEGYSQGGRGTKVHVYLQHREAISFYVYIVPSGLISIFLDVECDKISCGLQPTRFFQQKGRNFSLFLGKIIYVIKKVIKNYI